jgi:hypothetical protein
VRVTLYRVLATRDDVGWAIRVPALPGCFSQAATWAEVGPMARDAIACHQDVDPWSFRLALYAMDPAEWDHPGGAA